MSKKRKDLNEELDQIGTSGKVHYNYQHQFSILILSKETLESILGFGKHPVERTILDKDFKEVPLQRLIDKLTSQDMANIAEEIHAEITDVFVELVEEIAIRYIRENLLEEESEDFSTLDKFVDQNSTPEQ